MNSTHSPLGQGKDYSAELIIFANGIERKSWAALLCAGLALIITISVRADQRKAIAPYSGYRTWFEPTWLVRLRFLRNAQEIISEGYQKVRMMSILLPIEHETNMLEVQRKYFHR